MGHDVGQFLFYAISRRRVETAVIHVKMNIYAKWACLYYLHLLTKYCLKM